MSIFRITKEGLVEKIVVDKEIIQASIDSIKGTLTDSYYNLEKECIKSYSNDIVYRTYFNRNTVTIPIFDLKSEKLGDIPNYQYYEDIYFDENFILMSLLKVRIDSSWKFKYIIKESKERMTPIVIQLLKKCCTMF